jgi:death-on-curing protein
LSERDALTVHEIILALDGGAPDLRDAGLLSSALARPRQYLAYGDRADVVLLAALCTAGIVRNHPFVDGNKRTGFMLGVLFLEINGHDFLAAEAEATQAVLAVAAGDLDEAGYAAFLAANVRPVE